jgi:hypothetical protein
VGTKARDPHRGPPATICHRISQLEALPFIMQD